MEINEAAYPICCTGDVCWGDVILFSEAVFSGSFRKPRYVGDRRIVARVTNDSYGEAKQQHTFSLLVLASDGVDALSPGDKTRRKGRTVYRNGTYRARWKNEDERLEVIDEKHARGDIARAARDERRMMGAWA